MGVYRYTLRATTKKVRGVPLAQFKFAYKHFWGDYRDPVCVRLEKAGDRAAEKLRRNGVKLAVQGDWRDGQPVYWFDAIFGAFTEELHTTPRVGTLCKDERGRWFILLKTDEEMLAAYPEIGVLQTEQGRMFYHTMRGEPLKRNMLWRVVQDVMVMRLVKRAA